MVMDHWLLCNDTVSMATVNQDMAISWEQNSDGNLNMVPSRLLPVSAQWGGGNCS